MKIKFSWGTGITIFIIVFLILIISFVLYTTQFKINLVEEDYYQQELQYENHLVKLRNTAKLSGKINFLIENRDLYIEFPDTFLSLEVKGEALLYCPSDFEKDVKVKLDVDENGIQYINLENFSSGRYIIKLDWIVGSSNYYQQKTILLN